MKKAEKDKIEILRMRAYAHWRQNSAFEYLLWSIKPQWHELNEKEFCYLDDPKCPINQIRNIYHAANKAWEHGEDWKMAAKKAEQKCYKRLKKLIK